MQQAPSFAYSLWIKSMNWVGKLWSTFSGIIFYLFFPFVVILCLCTLRVFMSDTQVSHTQCNSFWLLAVWISSRNRHFRKLVFLLCKLKSQKQESLSLTLTSHRGTLCFSACPVFNWWRSNLPAAAHLCTGSSAGSGRTLCPETTPTGPPPCCEPPPPREWSTWAVPSSAGG